VTLTLVSVILSQLAKDLNKMKRIIPYLLLVLLGLSGCAAFGNFDKLSVMGEYSREKDNQHRLVKSVDDHYDDLTRVIAQGQITQYKDESSFLHSFGSPILKKDLSSAGQRWLYRYAIYKFARTKVYVYFDRNGKQVKWEKLSCPKLF
jgi:Txe/YoeB family toxin of Txe-Axe toxin-antitoxin module